MTEPPLEVETVLVPVDGSDESVEAVEYAVAVAEQYEASVHAMYVLGEELVRGIESGAVAKEDVLSDTETFMDTVRDLADEYGVTVSTSNAFGFSTTRKTQHPGSAVLDTAEDIDADFIVIPREPLTGEPGEVLEKAAEYVLLYASQPVLSV
ncbi:universal stress protein [Halorussus lipolyticus]|uniref:universal stress protein n=1 Tax=Halorussus lipolyticus TaxID=3034024 RepID=UPI0023E861FA|nr:universal stress protein [Halorussus sp. DT80]